MTTTRRAVLYLAFALGGGAALTAASAAGPAAPPKAGDAAPDFTLPALGGGAVRLSDLRKGGPVALIVLRGYPGYQCPVCTRQFGELRGQAERFAAAGATVLFVYPGPSAELQKRASEFVGNGTLPAGFRFALDPDYKFTNAYGLRWDAPNETAYPSAFVIDRAGKATFAKVSRSHGGRASAAELLAALPQPAAKPAKP